MRHRIRIATWMMLLGLPAISVSTAYSQVPAVRGVCVLNCDAPASYGGGNVYVPQGPSPQELRRQRDQRELREAAEHALDKGVDAWERGDYEEAARQFRESFEYNPDDDVARINLQKAEAKLAEIRLTRSQPIFRSGTAVEQLIGADAHSREAARRANSSTNLESASEEGTRGFDRRASSAGGIDVPVRADSGFRRPIVPPSRRTPQIVALERERDLAEERIRALEQRIVAIDPKRDPVALVNARQEKTNEERKVQMLDFSIGEIVDSPAR